MRRSPSLYLLAVLAVTAPNAVVAQREMSLRYAPVAGATVRTLTEERVLTTLFGFLAVPDGAAFESERRIGSTQRVLAAAGGAWTVQVTVDSVHARRRPQGGTWRTLADTTTVGRPARAVLDGRFAVAGIETTGETDAEVLYALGAGVIGLGFRFPEDPVRAGQRIPTGGRVHVQLRLGAEAGVPLSESLLGDLTLSLDSVADRGSDELAYFQFGGTFVPRTSGWESEAGSVTASLTGSFAGRLIWSQAWNAFVSGVTRMRVQGRFRTESAAGASDARVEWDATVTHRVRS